MLAQAPAAAPARLKGARRGQTKNPAPVGTGCSRGATLLRPPAADLFAAPVKAAPGPVTAAFRHSLAGRGPDRCAAPGSIRLRASAGLSPFPGSLWPRLERTLPVRCLVESSVRSGRRAVNTEAGEGLGLRRGWSDPPRKGPRVCAPARPSQRGLQVASAPRGGARGAAVVLPIGLGGGSNAGSLTLWERGCYSEAGQWQGWNPWGKVAQRLERALHKR